jgi:hypothetical protein
MYRLQLIRQVDGPWQKLDPISVGRTSNSPDTCILVERHEQPFARIDIDDWHVGPFTDAVIWKRYVVIGFGEWVYLVDPSTREKHSFQCDGYFGHLYPLEEFVLVASADDLFSINENAELVWRSTGLAIDGVVVNHVENGVIYGEGEWDPPGDWREFKLSLADGQSISVE